jgi:hypothetical protein
MQVALCVIFAGTVGLAQVVVVHHRHASMAATSSSRPLGPVKRMNLPTGWVIRSHDKDPVFLFDQEPDRPEQRGRTLTGKWQRLPQAIPIDEYLQTSQLADPEVRVVSIDGKAQQEIQMGDGPGILMATTRSTEMELPAIKWIACTIRPDGTAITLELDCPGDSDPAADKQVLLDSAQSMEFRD